MSISKQKSLHSEFSFKEQRDLKNNKNANNDLSDIQQSFFQQLHSQFYPNEQQVQSKQTSKTHKITRLPKQEFEEVLKFLRKYEPLYMSKTELKQLIYQLKKGTEIKKYKQAYYIGQIFQNQDGKSIKKGKGILIYDLFSKNSSKNIKKIYEGQWDHDQKNGLGFQRFNDGSVYHGHYLNSKPEGKGKLTNANGQIYEGTWVKGIKHGQGYWKGISGQTYMGDWNNSKPQGYGIFVNQKGDRYEGQFKNSLKHGQGIQKFINGDIYKGLYENGKPGGFGQYYWNNKSFFKGYFKNGLRCGQGLWKKGAGNCDKYQGQYQTDKKWGYGIFTWSNGNVYKGNYSGDLRNGYGQMHWKDGSYYKGTWKDGVQNGHGQLYIVGQGLRRGVFENNEIIQLQQQIDDQSEQNEQNMQPSPKGLVRNKSLLSKLSLKSRQSKESLGGKSLNKSIRIKKMGTQVIGDGKNRIPQPVIPESKVLRPGQLSPLVKIQRQGTQPQQVAKKDRLLHSSFYIQRFRNLGKPTAHSRQFFSGQNVFVD